MGCLVGITALVVLKLSLTTGVRTSVCSLFRRHSDRTCLLVRTNQPLEYVCIHITHHTRINVNVIYVFTRRGQTTKRFITRKTTIYIHTYIDTRRRYDGFYIDLLETCLLFYRSGRPSFVAATPDMHNNNND